MGVRLEWACAHTHLCYRELHKLVPPWAFTWPAEVPRGYTDGSESGRTLPVLIQNHLDMAKILRGEASLGLRFGDHVAVLTAPPSLSPCQDPARPDGAGGAHACAGAAARAGRFLLRPGGPHKAGRRAAGACLLHGLGPPLTLSTENQVHLESHGMDSVTPPMRIPHHLGGLGPGHLKPQVGDSSQGRGEPGDAGTAQGKGVIWASVLPLVTH